MGFECYHPGINLLFFLCVIPAAVVLKQPVFLLISFLCAFAYSVRRGKRRTLIFDLCLIPLVLLFTWYYVSFHHFGMTVLWKNFIGNNMTLEAFLRGLTIGLSAASVLMWLSCLFSVFTADKVVYLFGRISPRLSLFLSVLLRMCPRIKAQAKKIGVARRGIGRGVGQGNLFRRIANACRIFSMLISWLIEAMATISDSMKSRGYLLRGRTAFSIYRFDNRDRGFVVALFSCLTVVIMGMLLGQTGIRFDPRIHMNPITPLSALFYLSYAVLCLLPLGAEVLGECRFERLKKRTA